MSFSPLFAQHSKDPQVTKNMPPDNFYIYQQNNNYKQRNTQSYPQNLWTTFSR